MKIYVGVWQLKQAVNSNQCMFSLRTLKKRKTRIPMTGKDWLMDSGAFSELNINGKYTFEPKDYLEKVELHQPSLFFNMDYMCEPFVLQKTGMTVQEHQNKTIENQIKIMDILNKYNIKGDFAGCIQGWQVSDYLRCIDKLKDHGLITRKMGVGSICRRNSEKQIIEILQVVKKELPNTKLHGFGVKTGVLKEPIVYECLDSCDSMAWSFAGRRVNKKPCLSCIYPTTKNCANCYVYMQKWYASIKALHDITIKQKTFNVF